MKFCYLEERHSCEKKSQDMYCYLQNNMEGRWKGLADIVNPREVC